MKAKIKVLTQDWTGWSEKQPEPQESEIEVSEGESIELKESISNPTASIKSISDESVVLVTAHLAPKEEGQGTDLRGDYNGHETEINVGESAKFTTQTMDAGTSYTFTLLEITQ